MQIPLPMSSLGISRSPMSLTLLHLSHKETCRHESSLARAACRSSQTVGSLCTAGGGSERTDRYT